VILRFHFDVAGIKEIHTEVYAYDYIFSFAQNVGVRIAKVSEHWLYEISKGKLGEFSASESSIGKRFINNKEIHNIEYKILT